MVKTKRVSFTYRGKRISIQAKECNGLNRVFGLMFRDSDSNPLIFNFRRSTNLEIHSFFVFFSFVAVWLDDKNKVIDVRKVEPFTFSVSPKNKFLKLIEIPVGKKYSRFVKMLLPRR